MRGFRTILLVAVVIAAAIGVLSLLAERRSPDWEAFRHNAGRTAEQMADSALKDPARVRGLHVLQSTTPVPAHNPCKPPDAPCPVPVFRASPIVSRGKLYIGSTNGYLYAYDANDLHFLWRFPDELPALQSKFHCGASSFGIAASATIAEVKGRRAVIFAAPDKTEGNQNGEGHLFAVNADTGGLIWKSDVIAHLTGLTHCGFEDLHGNKELHEKTGYSSPIVWNGRVYIGISDHCDNPIQKGRVRAVNVDTGRIVPGFEFCSAGSCTDNERGGGVWSSVAVGERDLFITTGNTKINTTGPICNKPGAVEPRPNFGLSLLRLNASTGAVKWQFQPVPYALDQDPDWAAGATVMSTSCGTLILSTMKDGWTYALHAEGLREAQQIGGFTLPRVRWGFPRSTVFQVGDGSFHGDTQYKRPGAAWGDVYVTTTAGYQASSPSIREGYRRLYAFDVCSVDTRHPVRWILDVPSVSDECSRPPGPFPSDKPHPEDFARNCLGPPTVTGGIFFIGTGAGHLIAVADPSVPGAFATRRRCSNPDYPVGLCDAKSGYRVVWEPEVLADIELDGTPIMTEPVLVNGKVYVATDDGRIYLLEPSRFGIR